MKLKWDISCPTYIEFLPFIYDILDSSLQEDIGKGNQVRSCQFLVHFWTRPNVKLFLRQTKRCPIICDQKNFDNMSTNTLTNSQHSAIGKVRFSSLWRHDPVCYVIITFLFRARFDYEATICNCGSMCIRLFHAARLFKNKNDHKCSHSLYPSK